MGSLLTVCDPCSNWYVANRTGPAWEAIKWEPRLFESQIEPSNPFKGLPRPELDEAWNKLLDPTAIRVSKEDLDKINRTSVPLLDGSGYMASLDVYHQLHCLVSFPALPTLTPSDPEPEIRPALSPQRLLQHDGGKESGPAYW